MWLPPNLKTSATAVFVLTSLVSSVSASCSSGGQADIVFVMDASGSVGASNFARLKVFVQDLVNDFDIGSNTIRVGVEKYESKSYTEFNLNAYYVKSTMVSVIGNIYYSRGGTNTGMLSDIKAFYKASCLDLVVHSSNLTKAGEIAATMVALCNVGSTSSTPLTVASYWCDDYAGNYLLGTGSTCSQTCLYPNTTLSTRTLCVCADGYWGTGCDQTCPGGASNVCNGHGTCNSATGTCNCQVNWRGSSDCGVCTAGWTGSDCSVSYLATMASTICTVTNMGSWPAPMGNRWGGVLVYCERDTFCRITIDYVVEIVVEAFNGEMFAGLLGNADGDWLNEFYVPGPYSTTVYTSDYLSAYNKSAEAESAHTVTSGNTVLNHTDLSSVVTATAGWLIRGNGSVSVTYYNMNFTAKDEFTMEMWVYVDETVGQSYDLITFDTDLGVGVLGLDNGQLKLDWNKTYTSYMSVAKQTWTYVAITWRSSDGLTYFYTLTSPGGATALDMEWGFPYGSNLTISSLTFGGNAPYDVSFDYARVWSVVRGLDDFNAGLGTYDTQMHYGLEFLTLFDDGTGSSAVASVVINDTVLYVQGAVTGGTWAVSDIPTADVYYPADLPAIVNQTEVVEACLTEFNTSLTEYCPSFGAIKQLLVELCISDYIRTNDPSMVKMAASAFAFYCQAVTQEKECYFKGYLDFCPDPVSSEDLLPLILGAVFGTLLCCSCSICLAGLIKKKLMDDAKLPEKKPEGPDGQKPDAE
ncbi:hypothetical protein BaRGS_00039938 [Batillaria attramentaria]|uniref:VWFA domain-containing protein n=1 Tax=Batillaria attramentaria TaxID=370345 RepID=A0ABD0J2P0_9CAEN